MADYVLEITLQSPLISGSGEDRVGLVDRDVAYDDLGLPILPGKRLKGLWREAYCDVVDAWKLCGKSKIPAVEDLFGETGQKLDPKGTYMHVSGAELKEASSLKPWLQYLQGPESRKLSVEDVIQYFATVRAQTAIDRLTGAASENTLHLTRTLRLDLVFQARVSFVNSPGDEVIKGLARGAAALQYMGTARTRGFGKVRCRLLSCRYTESDLTKYVLAHEALPSSTGRSSQTLTGPTTPPKSSHSNSLHISRYRLTLKEPIVIPTADGDPNTVMTRQDVPGSHLWGVAAWNYLHQSGHTSKDPDFCRLFLKGALRFLTAYPEAIDYGSKIRLVPIPHSIRKFKKDEELVDLAESLDEVQEKKPKKRLDSHYGRLDTGILKTHTVETERNYHHARAKDRSKGRALGTETRDGGAFFTYEAIQKEQTFQGAVLGSEADLLELKKWLKGGDLIGLGRSRSAQYSTAKFEWFGDVTELNELTEWNGFDEDESEAPPDLGNHLIITTMSPVLSVNTAGHPKACFPECELADTLGLDTSDLKLSRSYTRTELVSGYHTHLRLPRQQWPAIAAGSVFIFDIPSASEEEACFLREERLLQLERDGLGLRKGEGYGRVAVNRQDSDLTNTTEEFFEDFSSEAPEESPNSEVLNLLCTIVQTRCLSGMQQIAVTVATEVVKMPNSVLGQLRLFLQQNAFVENWDAFVKNLDNLRDSAKDILTKNEMNTSNLGISDLKSPLTLLRLFEEVWHKKISEHADEFGDIFGKETRDEMIEMLNSKHKTNVCRVFLGQLLTTLYRQSRS